MLRDFYLVFEWWATLFLVGAAAYPLTKVLLNRWWDRGYLFSKAVGMATVTYLIYLMGTLHLLAFNTFAIAISLGTVFVIGVMLTGLSEKTEKSHSINLRSGLLFLTEELFFFAALLFWSWIKAHEPSIHGLEKFMDFGFTKSILDSKFFPAPDMWYAGSTINYYYFGHIVMALLTKFSGLDLRYTFNLMLASIFAFTSTMSFSIGVELFQMSMRSRLKNYESGIMNQGKKIRIHNSLFMILSGLFTAFLVTLAGNLETIYAFTKGYPGDQVKPFWQLAWPISTFWQNLSTGLQNYWYANATRFIPYTIHEFPSYSFVVSDVHGHVLSIPFVLLAIALLVSMFINQRSTNAEARISKQFSNSKTENSKRLKFGILSLNIISDLGFRISDLLFYGFLVAVLLMTNALDGPVYLGLFFVLFMIHNSKFIIREKKEWKTIGIIAAVVTLAAGLTSLPFLLHFQSFVHGLAVNCPPELLENTKIGPLMFEGVEKCQHSPLWMLLILWGFFLYCGVWLIARVLKSRLQIPTHEKLLIIFFLFSLALIIFPEFFYFKDIYPMHFRSNTMFKLGYQAFILFSIVSAYTIVSTITGSFTKSERKFLLFNFQLSIKKTFFIVFLLPLLFLVSIYPIFSVRSYFDSLRTYYGLDGMGWLIRDYPDDYAAIEWLNENESSNSKQSSPTSPRLRGATMTGLPVIVEADGDSYTDYARFSAFTGLPTIIGWPVHEWLWRGSYDVVAPRREEVREIYESQNLGLTKSILDKYHVRFIMVGTLERQKYATSLEEGKFKELGKIVFRFGRTTIYEVE